MPHAAPTAGLGTSPLPPIGPIACGDHHTVACTEAGAVYAWGFGGYGRLGLSDQSDRYRPTLVPFTHGSKLADVRAGGTCSYALSKSGGAFFWGRTKSTGEASMYPKVRARF